MSINHFKLRRRFSDFYKERGHQETPAIPLIPKDDPTTLFTGSGMQPLVPYLLGEPHPQGKRLYNIQPCFRSQDIEEVGDNRHTTFFEMMGNWSLGDYFKKDQLEWCWLFFTKELGLPKEKLYISVFAGTDNIAKDEESANIWKSIGINKNHIFYYGADKNWWSRAGIPEDMPPGEPGGPDSEVFYDFGDNLGLHEQSIFINQPCHPNCQCGRFLEIGNSVFMEYKKNTDGSFSELPAKNVDFGGGLERILAAINNDPDMFKADVFWPIIENLQQLTNKFYKNNEKPIRVIADHIKAAVFIIQNGVVPSNKEQGYVLRRLIRRSAVKIYQLAGPNAVNQLINLSEEILKIYKNIYFAVHRNTFQQVITEEIKRFQLSLNNGLKKISTIDKIDGKIAFDLYQSYGFPLEITEELFKEKGQIIDKKQFSEEFEKHKDLSRTASAGKFKGGLADQSQQTIKYHTAAHLLHQAIFDVLGNDIKQEGSNITMERLRFDFYAGKKATPEELKKISDIIQEKIKQALPVTFKIIAKKEAYQLGAKSFFREKYPEKVKIYFIGDYSKEFCGGPHVKNTKEIGKIEIFKFEKIGSNLYRIYAK